MPDSGFTYLRESQLLYTPKTPNAALKAVENGLLPNDAFIYMANSVHPLFEEPVDIAAIERTLARKGNDLDTNLMLVRILERLLKSKDGETALFAAESINAIENSYNERIEELKKLFEKENDPRHLKSIAEQFYEVGLLNESRRGIRNFYLLEAYSYMKRYESEAAISDTDLIFILRLMISLKSFRLARSVVTQALRKYPENYRLILMAAEVEYHRRNYREVFSLIHRIKHQWEALPKELQNAFRHWIAEG